jgi:hypothetical protein
LKAIRFLDVLPIDPRAVDIAIKVYFSSRNKKESGREKGGKQPQQKAKKSMSCN